ncbi:hypothetical protein HMPREF1052_1682 [Pasteurella bettyae CCUG 2042]|uniref:Transposase n=1 Tax=Pasteurella bettyae CCUG 2042 TaxID=1095749 RepID=I3D9W1_9PAST|nr:hypothetical protein HMPREF1052_1682 [Pasteurella bettyae CCUG 2042]
MKQQVIKFYPPHGKNQSFTRQYFQLSEISLKRWVSQYNHNDFDRLSVLVENKPIRPNLNYL